MQTLPAWHRTKLGFTAFMLLELTLVYGFASLAIDRGNLWYYILTLSFVIGAIQNLCKLMGSFIRGGHKASQA